MARTRRPLTVDEHRELGIYLRGVHERLVKLNVDLANRGPKSSKVVRRAQAAHEALSKLRSELEEEMFRDHPELDGDAVFLNVYYGSAGRS